MNHRVNFSNYVWEGGISLLERDAAQQQHIFLLNFLFSHAFTANGIFRYN